jgi:cytochrome c-type biogenesis protein CcmH
MSRAKLRSMAALLALVTLGALLACPPARADTAPDIAADPALELRVQALAAELRCLVCQNQSLADSHADLALQLKDQVREQLRAGRSEQQVMAYMTERYGDFVRYRPQLKATTALLWTGPFLLLLAGLALLWRELTQRARRQREQPPFDEAEAERAARLLAGPFDPTAR